MKKVTGILAAIVALAGGATTAYGSPKDVSRLEVATYKDAVGMGCRDQGRRRGHPRDQVERRCKCVIDTLNARLTEEEWKRATFFAQERKEQDEARVLSPHMGAVKACGAEARK
jgi:hypothetical protein